MITVNNEVTYDLSEIVSRIESLENANTIMLVVLFAIGVLLFANGLMSFINEYYGGRRR